jgi:hypothetical protein
MSANGAVVEGGRVEAGEDERAFDQADGRAPRVAPWAFGRHDEPAEPLD